MLNHLLLPTALLVLASMAMPPAMAANGGAAQMGPIKPQHTGGKARDTVLAKGLVKAAPQPAPKAAPAALPNS